MLTQKSIDNMLRRLIICIILILFMGLSINSSAFNIETKYDKKIIDKNEIKTLDVFKEIFTKLNGYINAFKIKGLGIGLNIEMWSYWSGIELDGFRFYNPIFPFRNWSFEEDAKHVIIPNFIGYIGHKCDQSNTRELHGIAIGNIELE